jgi:hypothetical protein
LKEKLVSISRLVPTVLTSGYSLNYDRKYFALTAEKLIFLGDEIPGHNQD